jgi:hypothetical protein
MGKTVQLSEYQSSYKERTQETITYLEGVRDEIFTQMINIATVGVWKEWMKDIKTGDTFKFSADMLENTGDKNIEALWELYYKMDEVEERLAGRRK